MQLSWRHQRESLVCQRRAVSISLVFAPVHRPTATVSTPASVIHSGNSTWRCIDSVVSCVGRQANGRRNPPSHLHATKGPSNALLEHTSEEPVREPGYISLASQDSQEIPHGTTARAALMQLGGQDEATVAMEKNSKRSDAYNPSSSTPSSSGKSTNGSGGAGFAYAPSERSQIRETWATLMRWSKRTRQHENGSPLETTKKVWGKV